jgi:hypothetical protein
MSIILSGSFGSFTNVNLAAPSATPPAPPGDPYWSNVSLLLNNTSTNNQTNNTFVDSSTNNFTITRTGTPTQGSFTPLTVAANNSYSTTVNGGSAYFNGNGSYLYCNSNAAFSPGTGDFTIEMWVNFASVPVGGNYVGFCQNDQVGSSGSDKFWFGYLASTGLILGRHSTPNNANCAWSPTANTWYHIAVVRNSGTILLFINGVSQSVNNSTVFNGLSFGQNGFSIAGMSTPVYFNGYISGFRFVNGSAVHTSTFPIPTSPPTNISGTSLLLNFTNAGMYDAATKNNLIGVGDTKVSTAQAKFGSASVVFDGVGDSLSILSNTVFGFESGNYTVEMWINSSSYSAYKTLFSNRVNNATGFAVYTAPGNAVAFATNSNVTLASGSVLSTNTWIHIACVRNNGTVTLYVNGTSVGSVSDSRTYASSAGVVIGDEAIYPFDGYMQDVRVTKGVARYTSNFTPPTASFPTY